MSYLMREDIDFSEDQWGAIDKLVVNTASTVLIGRKFLDLYGPLGAGIQNLDAGNGSVKKFSEIHSDFTIEWQELESAKRLGIPLSLSQVAKAASECAIQEDTTIILGDEENGSEGLLTAQGVKKIKMQNWKEGENAFEDIAAGLQEMIEARTYGSKVLLVSPDIYAELSRIQPGTGLVESARIRELIDGKIFQSPVMPKQTAALIATGIQNMDIAIGQDLITGYLGATELNHEFRILETILLRIKNKNAIVVFKK